MAAPKVLFLVDSLQVGGTGLSLLALLRRLAEECPGTSIDVICLDGAGALAHEVPPGVRVSELRRRWPFRHGRRFFEGMLSGSLLTSLMIRHRRRRSSGEDTASAIMGLSQSYALRRTRLFRKCDDTFDLAISWTELGALYALVRKVDARQKLCWIHPDYRGAGFDPDIDRRFVEAVDGIVAVSATGERSIAAAFPELSDKTMCVRNIVDQDRMVSLSSRALGADAKYFGAVRTFVTVARLHDQSKALLRAVEVCQGLVDRGHVFRWLMVGDGPDRQPLIAAIQEAGLEQHMILLGARENPYPYIAHADAFILQSYYEGFPLVVEEALTLGTPVVVTEYPSAREQVRDGIDGCVVASDAMAITECLSSMIERPDELRALRVRAAQNPRPPVDDDYDEFVGLMR